MVLNNKTYIYPRIETMTRLKWVLRSRGLSTEGSRLELVDRVETALKVPKARKLPKRNAIKVEGAASAAEIRAHREQAITRLNLNERDRANVLYFFERKYQNITKDELERDATAHDEWFYNLSMRTPEERARTLEWVADYAKKNLEGTIRRVATDEVRSGYLPL